MDAGMASTSARRLGPGPPGAVRQRAAALLRAVAAATVPPARRAPWPRPPACNRPRTWRILTTLTSRGWSRTTRTAPTRWGFDLVDLAGQAGGAALVSLPAWSCSGSPPRRARPRPGHDQWRRADLRRRATADAVVAARWQGHEVTVHATSAGKVLLAYSHSANVPLLLRVPRAGDCHASPRPRSPPLSELE